MSVYQAEFTLPTVSGRDSYHDITSIISEAVQNSGLTTESGVVVVTTTHTTCSIFLEEYTHDHDQNLDDFLSLDLSDRLGHMIPSHASGSGYRYPGPEHFKAVSGWGNAEDFLPTGKISDLWNGDAHLKATLIGASVTLPIANGKIKLGKTSYIYFVDFDRTRERIRKYQVSVIY